MTNTAQAQNPTMLDPRPAFSTAVQLGRQVVAGVRPEQFALRTPCSDFDVHTLAAHLVAVLQRVAVVGRGEDPFIAPHFVTGIADADLLAAYDAFAAEAATVWADDAVLTNLLTLPWAKLPGAISLMIYVSEVSVHTWDLAVATGQTVAWDDSVLQIAYNAISRGLPTEGRMEHYDAAAAAAVGNAGVIAPFSAVVPTADDAPLIDKLVAWTGRQP